MHIANLSGLLADWSKFDPYIQERTQGERQSTDLSRSLQSPGAFQLPWQSVEAHSQALRPKLPNQQLSRCQLTNELVIDSWLSHNSTSLLARINLGHSREDHRA